MKRNAFSSSEFERIREGIEAIASLNVVVIGETIIDEYAYCEVLGKSGKEPTLVGELSHIDVQGGGVIAIANHLVDFCASVKVVSALGECDTREGFVRASFREGVDAHLAKVPNAATIVKRRYLDAHGKGKLLGVYKTRFGTPSPALAWEQEVERSVQQADLVVVADYGHDLLTASCAQRISEKSRFLALNCQMNASNLGYHVVSKYPRANFVCVHEGELRLDARDRTSALESVIAKTQVKMGCETIMITRGRHGTLLRDCHGTMHSSSALANAAVERVGAGDAVLALSALGCAAGLEPFVVGALANLAGARLVSVMGNRQCVRKAELLKTAQALFEDSHCRVQLA